ncbi:MAG: SPOR domain-containing protein [Candidatus Thiodiazotropha sp. (ex Lucinoma kastoroae)]|nr:SPOR domain-containing protein [Candidatus Thiodiazotropha sp. (ex Lucinoma kastoroae)]
MKESKLKKKEFVVRVEKLINQFSDLNSRLNRVSYDKVKQGIQLGQLSEDSATLQQQLGGIEAQIDQLASTNSDLSGQCRTLQEQISGRAPSDDSASDQQQSQEAISQLTLQFQTLQEQLQTTRQSLEHDRQSADHIANKSDDLRRDTDELLAHIRRLEESGSELSVSDSHHESQIHGLQSDIAELSQKLEQTLSESESLTSDTSQSLQETTEPLRNKLEQLSHLISENSGQNKDVERRLSELANRIGETGARIDHQQQDRERFDESLEHRLSGLEAVIDKFKSAVEVDKGQPEALDERLKQVGLETDRVIQEVVALQDNYHLLGDRDNDIAVHMDAIDGAMQTQSEWSQSTQDIVNKISDDLASERQGIDEQLTAVDQRLSDYIERESEQPDPIALISQEVEGERQQFNATIDNLKADIDALQSKIKSLDTDEYEVSDRINLLADSVDQQAGQREDIQQALTSTRDEISRTIAELNVRLTGAESLLSQQRNATQEQIQQLMKLSEAVGEQHRNAEVFKHLTAALQEDTSGLKEGSSKLHQRLDEVEQILKDENQSKDQVFQQLAAVEQVQTTLREQSDLGIDSLEERLKTLSAQLVEQSGLSDGLSTRLDDLASSLEEQFRNLDSKHQRLVESESDYLERLTRQESNNHSITEALSELQTGHQGLLGKSEQQTTFLEAMTAEYSKRQQASETMTQQLGQMGNQLESVQSTGSHHTKAIAGLSVLLLLLGLLGYWFISDGIEDVEREVSLELERYSENYMTRDEIERLPMTRSSAISEHQSAGGFDAEAITAIIKKQDGFEQQLVEIEEQFAASFDKVGDRSTFSTQDRMMQEQMQPAKPDQSAGQGSASNQLIEDRFESMESTLNALRGELEQRIEALEHQGDTYLSHQNEMAGNIDTMAASLANMKGQYQQIKKRPKSERGWQAFRGSGGYTIQLLGVSNKQAIAFFANKHNLEGELAFIETELNGKKWYILMHGIYGTFSEATNVLESLPDELKRNQPWIRSVPAEGILTPFN